MSKHRADVEVDAPPRIKGDHYVRWCYRVGLDPEDTQSVVSYESAWSLDWLHDNEEESHL